MYCEINVAVLYVRIYTCMKFSKFYATVSKYGSVVGR